VEGTAGGGAVTIGMNGKREVLSVKLDPQAVDPQDLEMLQDLILAAFQDAPARSRRRSRRRSGDARGLGVPGL